MPGRDPPRLRRRVGGLAATSFYPGKNLGAYGDAGAVVTSDAELARRVRLLGNHGSTVRYEHDVIGFNSRLDALQAVVLRASSGDWPAGTPLVARLPSATTLFWPHST